MKVMSSVFFLVAMATGALAQGVITFGDPGPKKAVFAGCTSNPCSGDWGVRLDGQTDDTVTAVVVFEFRRQSPPLVETVTKADNQTGKWFTLRDGEWIVTATVRVNGQTFTVSTRRFTIGNPTTPTGTVTVRNQSSEIRRGQTLLLSVLWGNNTTPPASLRLKMTLNRLGWAPVDSFLNGTFAAGFWEFGIPENTTEGNYSGVIVDANGNPISNGFSFVVFSGTITPPPVGATCGIEMRVSGPGANLTLQPAEGMVPVLSTMQDYFLLVQSSAGRKLTPGGITNIFVGDGTTDTNGTGIVPAPVLVSRPGLNLVHAFFDVEGCGQVRNTFRILFADSALKEPIVIADPRNVYRVGSPLRFTLNLRGPLSAWVAAGETITQAVVTRAQDGSAVIEFVPPSSGEYSLFVNVEGTGRNLPVAFFSVRRP